ncbi:peptidoglycan-binding protein [Streptomyces sp. NPDC015220]|uniref:peptidoglycan-binding domain-containing protein n=1 Tax=Streptomyces sp. NPDC015220 TaxID=3364947 RepID=UPI0036F84F41
MRTREWHPRVPEQRPGPPGHCRWHLRLKSATIAFQQCTGLTADGIIGPNTWSELDYWRWNDIDCHK